MSSRLKKLSKLKNLPNPVGKIIKTRSESESVITRLIERTNTMTRQDIASWWMALKTAQNHEQPRRILIYNLFDQLMLDNHLSAIVDARKRRVSSQKFRIVDKKTGKPIPEKLDLLNTAWFYKFLNLAMDSVFWGHSLIEMTKIENGLIQDITLIPRRHVVPEFGGLAVHQHDMVLIPYRNTPLMDYLIEVGEPRQLGLLAKAGTNMLMKKNALMAHSEYCEIFGMPIRVGKTNTKSNADLDRMAANLKAMGSAPYIVTQDGESIEFVESTKGDAYMVYDKLIERCNGEMSKLILGQTMTTDNGSSRSQSEVHERVADLVADDDQRFIRLLINDKLFPLLIKQGYDLNGCELEWDEGYQFTKEQWEIDNGLLQNFDIEPQYFVEKYGVPITGVKQATTTVPGAKGSKNNIVAQFAANETIAMHNGIHKLYHKDNNCC